MYAVLVTYTGTLRVSVSCEVAKNKLRTQIFQENYL